MGRQPGWGACWQLAHAAAAGRNVHRWLACPLPPLPRLLPLSRRGFKLLAAMGYREGQRIGREGTGLAEPLPLLLKQVGSSVLPTCLAFDSSPLDVALEATV